jgi:hypothetical protein
MHGDNPDQSETAGGREPARSPMTMAEAREHLEPLFVALARAHRAYCAVMSRTPSWSEGTARRSIGARIREAEKSVRHYEEYHAKYWGPLDD